MKHQDRKLMIYVQAFTAILSCVVILLAAGFVWSVPSVPLADGDALFGVVQPSTPARDVDGTGAFSSDRGSVLEALRAFSGDLSDVPNSLVARSRQFASGGSMTTQPDKEFTPTRVKERGLSRGPGANWEEETSSSLTQQQLPSEPVEAERARSRGDRAFFAGGAVTSGLKVARAEDMPDITSGRAPNLQEVTLLAAGEEKSAPWQTQKIPPRFTIEALMRSFIAERDPEGKQDVLAAAAELSASEDISMRPILEQALLAHQPLKVRQQALYLAADMLPELVRKIAADSSHPLQQEAAAFLLEAKLPGGIIPTDTGD